MILMSIHPLACHSTTDGIFRRYVALIKFSSHQVIIEAPWIIAQTQEWNIGILQLFSESNITRWQHIWAMPVFTLRTSGYGNKQVRLCLADPIHRQVAPLCTGWSNARGIADLDRAILTQQRN